VTRRLGKRRVRAPLAPSARKAGLPPGELVYTGIGRDHDVTTHVMVYDPSGHDERREASFAVALAAIAEAERHPVGRVTWIDVTGVHDLDALRQLGEALALHPLTLEDIASVGQRPKAEPFDGYLFLSLRTLSVAPAVDGVAPALRDEQVSVVVREHLVVTFHERPVDHLEPLRERIRRGIGRLPRGDAGYLAYSLLDGLVDQGFVALEALSQDLERLEEQALTAPYARGAAPTLVLEHLVQLKRELAHLRRVTSPTRELLGALRRDAPPELGHAVLTDLRDVYDHAARVLDSIDGLREVAGTLHETYVAGIAHRTNETLRVLTVFTALFMPLTFLVGVYGMNFRFMPELAWPWGYPALWAVMLVLIVVMLIWFRRRRWL
jgi:magnesium transporter